MRKHPGKRAANAAGGAKSSERSKSQLLDAEDENVLSLAIAPKQNTASVANNSPRFSLSKNNSKRQMDGSPRDEEPKFIPC